MDQDPGDLNESTMELRQRRSDAKQPDLGDDSSDPIGEPAAKPVANRGVYTTGLRACLAIVMGARVLSALLNLIHDCDEVYNYWEPLHFLVYGSGFKTWEYRCADRWRDGEIISRTE